MACINDLVIDADSNKYTPGTVNLQDSGSEKIRKGWFSFLARGIILSFAAAGGYKDLEVSGVLSLRVQR